MLASAGRSSYSSKLLIAVVGITFLILGPSALLKSVTKNSLHKRKPTGKEQRLPTLESREREHITEPTDKATSLQTKPKAVEKDEIRILQKRISGLEKENKSLEECRIAKNNLEEERRKQQTMLDQANLRLGAWACAAMKTGNANDMSTLNRPGALVHRYESLYLQPWAEACFEIMKKYSIKDEFAMELLCCTFVVSFEVTQHVAKKQRCCIERMLVNLINLSFAPCQENELIEELQKTCSAQAGEPRKGGTNHPLVDVVLDHVKFKQCSLAVEDMEYLQKMFTQIFPTYIKLYMEKFHSSEAAVKQTLASTGSNVDLQVQNPENFEEVMLTSTGLLDKCRGQCQAHPNGQAPTSTRPAVGNEIQETAQVDRVTPTSTELVAGCEHSAQSDGETSTGQCTEYKCQTASHNDGETAAKRLGDGDLMSTLFDGKFIGAFKDQCLALAWYMNVQTPPMFIDYLQHGSVPFNVNVHDRYIGEDNYVTKCIWPTLYYSEGGAVAVKGKFVCSATGPEVCSGTSVCTPIHGP